METSGIFPFWRDRLFPRKSKEAPFWPGASDVACKAWKDAEKKTQLQMRIVQEAIRGVTQLNPQVTTVIGLFLQEAHTNTMITRTAQEERSYLRQYENELGAIQAATDDRYQREIGSLFAENPERGQEFRRLSARAAEIIQGTFEVQEKPSQFNIINAGLVSLFNQLYAMIPNSNT